MNQERLAINEATMLNLFVQNPTIKAIYREDSTRQSTSRPILVVKYGPPASGKGSDRTQKAIESLGVKYDEMIHFNIDDVIESLEQFRGTSRKQLEQTFKYMTNSSLQDVNKKNKLKANLNIIGNNNIKDFSKIYFNIRNAPINAMRTQTWQLIDTMMGKAMKSNLNISMETTGSFSFPDWLFTDPKTALYIKNYQVVFVFPTVHWDTAWSRYKARPINRYLKGGPFRFGSTKVGYAEQYIASYTAFIEKMPTLMTNRENVSYIIVPNDVSNSQFARIERTSSYDLKLILGQFVARAEEFMRKPAGNK